MCPGLGIALRTRITLDVITGMSVTRYVTPPLLLSDHWNPLLTREFYTFDCYQVCEPMITKSSRAFSYLSVTQFTAVGHIANPGTARTVRWEVPS